MKRKLTEDEKEKTEKGITRLEKELADMQEAKEFNRRTIEFQKLQQEYEDYVRPYMRKQKEEKDKKAIEYLEQELKMKQATLDNLKDQINNGVEVKNKGG